MLWAVLGMFHSIFRAVFAETNRIYRLDSWQLTFWHSACAALILIPCIPFMHWPAAPDFYLAAVLVALILSVGTIIQLNLVDDKKGRTSVISIPFEAFAAFIIWIIISPYARFLHVQNPLLTGLVVLSLVVAAGALLRLRRHDVGWQSFLVVAPVGVTYAVAGVTTKYVIPAGDEMFGSVLAYIMINYVIVTMISGLFLLLKKKAGPELYSRTMVKAGAMTGVFALAAYLTFVLGVVLAPNPGFVSILAVLVPVWLMWYHELRFIKDKANPIAAVLIVASIFMLIAASYFMKV